MTFETDLKTKGMHHQYQFDSLISDTDISGLKFLKEKYKNDLNYFRHTHDLNELEKFSEYREMQQRFKMINEELFNRYEYLENSSLAKRDTHFNENYDIVSKEDNEEIKVIRPSLASDGTVELIEIDEEDVRQWLYQRFNSTRD